MPNTRNLRINRLVHINRHLTEKKNISDVTTNELHSNKYKFKMNELCFSNSKNKIKFKNEEIIFK